MIKDGRAIESKTTTISVAVDPAVYERIEQLAASRDVSLSTVACDLIKDALAPDGDEALARLAAEHEATFRNDSALSHEDVWD